LSRSQGDRLLLGGFVITYVLFGIGITLIGATVPAVIRSLGWSYTDTGLVMAAGSMGYLLSAFWSGVLVERLGAKKMIVGSLLLTGLATGLFGMRPGVVFNVAVMLLLGLGQGGIEIVTNVCIVRIESDGRSRLMNLMHAAFTAGAVVGPMGVGFLLKQATPWRTFYLVLTLCWLLAAVAMLFLGFSVFDREEGKPPKTRTALWDLARQPLLILAALTLFLYIGIEIGVTNWLAEYCVEVLGTSAGTGAFMVSVFWAGLLIGRLLFGLVYRGRQQTHLLLGLALMTIAALVPALLVSSVWAVGLSFFCVGIGLSGIYPIVMVLVGLHFERRQSLAIGTVATAGGIGSLVFPLTMAGLAEQYSLTQSFWFCIVLAVLMGIGAVGILVEAKKADLQTTRDNSC
jgi:fucose permease